MNKKVKKKTTKNEPFWSHAFLKWSINEIQRPGVQHDDSLVLGSIKKAKTEANSEPKRQICLNFYCA